MVCPDLDQSIRVRPGERLHQLFEGQCDRLVERGEAGRLAVDGPLGAITYDGLDRRANQLARELLGRGIGPGCRVALLFDRAVDAYVAMLAVSKVHAAYVPLDAGFPPDRLAYIVSDAGTSVVLSVSRLADHLRGIGADVVHLDVIAGRIGGRDDRRLSTAEVGDPVDSLSYIIYTSGSTGRPKGVAIEHASICNFVRVAAEVYGLRADDRVYQGMTIAFDFSVEEIWVPWMCGATLVPKPSRENLLGPDLQSYLFDHQITALVCVPTLLATLDEHETDLRFLLVSGEACPRDLIARWHRPERRFLNVYGPTEATVTATWTPVHPDRPVTIGVPLPTYSVVILDPEADAVIPPGGTGEIGIAGIGLSSGYVNRPDLTAKAFIADFLGIENNPSGRIYRTGDLGRVGEHGEIEFLGRIDTQVKIRGYRIELSEIESVAMQVPGIAQAVVDTYEPEPGVVELVAYFSPREGTHHLDHDDVRTHLQAHLPAYMVPAYFEQVATIPMLPSGKADRRGLPAPSGSRRSATTGPHVAPATETEAFLADTLARVLRIERVSVDDHIFDDLGANSLLMARFCAEVRGHASLPSVSMRDVYRHPRVRDLAAVLTAKANGQGPAAIPPPLPPPESMRPAAPAGPRAPVSAVRHVAFGAAQALAMLLVTSVGFLVFGRVYRWISAEPQLMGIYLRSVVVGVIAFVVLTTLPIVAKWTLVGRWKVQEIPLWSLAHLRFWLVKSLTQTSPVVLFVGSPLYVLYLRALGAHIGRGVVMFSRRVPVCTDLLTIGSGTVLRKDTSFSCYRAQAGMIRTGPVTIGSGVVVGEMSILDLHVSLGDGAQLGHSSCLLASQSVPAGQRWHGSPAVPTDVDFREVEPVEIGRTRPFTYGALQLLNRLLGTVPLFLAVMVVLAREVVLGLDGVLPATSGAGLLSGAYLAQLLGISFVLLIGGLVVRCLVVLVYPRLLNLPLQPDRVYPLYGLHYTLQRGIARVSNARQLNALFGDSSAVVHYLRALGYDLGQVEQTGSNFGMTQKHEVPFLVTVGRGTMISDGLSFGNAAFSSTSFRVSRTTLGERCFVGNSISYPAGARVGDNCLLGTKVMVPIDGPVRHDVGLLGSPAFEIPRSVERDSRFDKYKEPGELSRRLHRKNRHNLATASAFLLARWILLFCILVISTSAWVLYLQVGEVALMLAGPVLLVFSIGFGVLVERAARGFRDLQPQFCSIYDTTYWRQERYWKLSMSGYVGLFNGTPLKTLIWRMLGVRIGKRVFDDGCGMPEKTLVTIGDDCVLNSGSLLQCHSLEDGTFKSEHVSLGAGCVLGTGSFVHYGVAMGDGAVLEADAFLMKGSELAPGSRWLGNPACETAVATPRSSRRAAQSPLAVVDALHAVPARVFGPPGVTVSIYSLAACRRQERELLALVSDDELAEAGRMGSQERRTALLCGRALMRLALTAERPDVAPSAWRLSRESSGKVTVASPPDTGLDVSVSHTDTAVVVAVSGASDVGVDLEPLDSALDQDVLWSVLSPAEQAALRAIPLAERTAHFVRLWTMKEAVAKSLGAGSAMDFSHIEISLDPPRVLSDGPWGYASDYWAHCESLTLGDRAHSLSVVARPQVRADAGRPPAGGESIGAGGREVRSEALIDLTQDVGPSLDLTGRPGARRIVP